MGAAGRWYLRCPSAPADPALEIGPVALAREHVGERGEAEGEDEQEGR